MRYILFIVLTLSIETVVTSQNLDFEQTGFEIKSIAMENEPSALGYHIAKNEQPSRFYLSEVLKENEVKFSATIENENLVYHSGKSKDPKVKIAPLKPNDIYAFSQDGGINGVKNIAYKPAQGGNIYDAYCRAVYASRNSN